jgi:cation diffusion facilitator CzcD-associated flavoprotein CzcO
LSGIGAACHLSQNPDKTYIILEARTEVGGLEFISIPYSGIRSDSDMYFWMT